jgi:hypothetical protein
MKFENIEVPDKYESRSRIVTAAWLLYLALPVIVALDITSILCNKIIFRMAGIPQIDRKKYIKPFSRMKLPNATIWYKFGCVYCSYANGVAYYYKDTAMSIEVLYCPWKQKDRTRIQHHTLFMDW